MDRKLSQGLPQGDVSPDSSGVAVEVIHAFAVGHPEMTFLVFAARLDVIARESGRVRRIVRELADAPAGWIEAEQTPASRQPQQAGAILADVPHELNRIVREGFGQRSEP